MIQHIVFDIGLVLLHWDPERPYRRLIPDEARRRWFLETVCTPAWNKEQDRGRSWADAEAELIAAYPDEAELIRAYRQYWHEMVPTTLPGTPEILTALVETGHDVTLLTNFNQDTYRVAQQNFEVLGRARGVTVSGEIGIVKPDRAIYDHHARTFGLAPEATLFFDDSPANVEGAIAAGWQAKVFTGAAQMRADLAAAGITVPETAGKH